MLLAFFHIKLHAQCSFGNKGREYAPFTALIEGEIFFLLSVPMEKYKTTHCRKDFISPIRKFRSKHGATA